MASDRRERAFTLIEMMVVVAIIGILAAVAIPAFMRNARKAKSSEASVEIRKLYASSRVYILEEFQRRGAMSSTDPQFPDANALTPLASCCTFTGSKCPQGDPVNWKTPTWTALQFAVDDPHYYRYEYASTGTAQAGPGSAFTARALGDLNCDGVYSTFEMIGVWSSEDHDVHGSAGIFQVRPTE